MFLIPIKPLSQNLAWSNSRKGRYKTKKYKDYESAVTTYLMTFDLPKIKEKEPFCLYINFEIRCICDLTNCIKLFEDILCRHIGTDDRYMVQIFSEKTIVSKDNEFIKFGIYNHKYDLLKALNSEM